MPEKTFTIEDLLCMLDEVEPGRGRRGYELLVATFRQGPQAELYAQIEQMAEDAGTDRSRIGWEREAVEAHRTLERLLAAEPAELTQELAGGLDPTHADHPTLLRICTARRARGEGEDEKLAALATELSAFAPEPYHEHVRRVQEKLDAVLDELMLAYAAEEGPAPARRQAAQHLLARALRELRALEQPAWRAAAG